MRIGIFTDTYPPHINGVATSVLMLKTALEKKGHQVFIVTVNDDALEYKFENDDTIIRIPGIPIGIYDYRLTGIYPVKAINTIRKWNLDVIHSHTEFGVGTFARIVAKQFNIPLIHSYHTMYEDYIHYITKGYFDKSSKKIVEYLTLQVESNIFLNSNNFTASSLLFALTHTWLKQIVSFSNIGFVLKANTALILCSSK